MSVTERLYWYSRLIRLDKPVGTLLLLWPTLGALWLAAGGVPDWKLLLIYSLGTLLMRSAGCAVNDYADRDFDKHVKRTAERPITSGKISGKEALAVAVALALISFALIIPLNTLTRQLSVFAVLIAASYPYFKRFFAIPQAYLGIAFGFGIPMAYASVQNMLPASAWLLLIANVFWAVAYDTEYAMVDRDDDLKIGIKTSAITFGRFDVLAVMLCYGISLGLITLVGLNNGLGKIFLFGIATAALCALYHYVLIKDRERMSCFAAFRHNNWLGAAIFAGIAFDYALK
ncbi:4-hydroxybenzoate octaprenyltransferase [Undibacterium crateris]|uniref:4-hydroxybenzoate octaprenyltransferase n=1 Tax=Undibacterium crateris TaxID=2528175 RepID=UPI001389CEAB|nr:4-hydroxybenzoate octaprenyltransferase [Undibacterium crateris]NDI86148.1 4-hydroxybenzoate octaprenyltransferase [Undibacterium crateris]